jgi:hypothetical protein
VEKRFENSIDSAAVNAPAAIQSPMDQGFSMRGARMMLIAMHVGDVLHFWALTLTTAYSVVAFIGYIGLVYASPIVDQTICASEPATDADAQKKSGAFVPFVPRRAKIQVEDQALEWAA